MVQYDESRLLVGDDIPALFHPELRLWSRIHRSGYFRRDEEDLYSIAALSYADAARPTMTQVYRLLCSLIDEDASRGGARVRKPSFSTLRKIIRSLPAEFVHRRRHGHLRAASTFDLVSAASGVLGITAN
ncbi:hypothetical protein [Neorhizobium tomejilense]|uniref:hypothetical protein n=1 Tax=Neorhizobium tomejilense TaxID=2093828 RepID=UPI000CF8DE27|nr:hypothetical protein [Neorhizobium tomejilense]